MNELGRVSTWVFAIALLTGCATAPIERVAPATPAAFSAAAPADEATLGAWWTAFGDPQLTHLIERALSGHPDMAAAQARIAQARAQARVARAALGPSLNLSGGATTTQLSENALPPGLTRLTGGDGGQESGGGGLGLPGDAFTTYQTGFDAAWEIDLFGARRAGRDAAQARAEAAEWSARDAAVRLSAEVARAYFNHAGLVRRLALADESLAASQALLAAAETQGRHGLTDGRVAANRRAARDQAVAARAALAAEVEIALHALSTLCGEAPLALSEQLTAPAAWRTPDIAPGLPADLLRRRPDLRAAERRLAAADADIAAARADLYPKLTLNGTAQLASLALSSLLSADSLQATGAVRASVPLFDGGRRKATLAGRRAEAAEAEAAWRGQLLTALKEAEDSLSRLAADKVRSERLAGAAQAAGETAAATTTREANGLIGASESLDAKLAWLQARDAEAQAQTQNASDAVALFKALGCGWGHEP